MKISEGDLERIMFSSGNEREILCEALLGLSFLDAQPILEYEMLMSKVLAGKWMITDINNTFGNDGDCRIRLGVIDRNIAVSEKMWFTLRPFQLDDRFVKAMRRFAAATLGYPTSWRGKAVEDTSIVKLAKSLVALGKGENH